VTLGRLVELGSKAMSVEESGKSPAAGQLQRHPSLDDRFDPAVRIVDYDSVWPVLAEQELRRIKDAVGDVAVRLEHVGSTAVPGLAAKPIIDLQLSVDTIEPQERYVVPLERLGYLFAPAPESPDCHFFGKPPERPRNASSACLRDRKRARVPPPRGSRFPAQPPR
jgi:GrpB-like predicted nucleotidyltransferase (UPF0157 family)